MPPRKPASQSPFGSSKHSIPLLVMPQADIAALRIAPGDCIEYRTARMLPEAPLRVCTVDEARDGVLVLSDGEHLHRRDCVWLRRHQPEAQDVSDGRGSTLPRTPTGMGTAAGTGEYPRDAAAPAGEARTPAAPALAFPRVPSAARPKRQGAHMSDADRARWTEACHRIRNLQLSGMRQPDAIAQVARDPGFAGLKLNVPNHGWWANRLRKAGLLGPSLKSGSKPGSATPPGPRLVSLPPPAGADEPPATPPAPAPAPAPGAAAAVASARADSAAGAPIPEGVRGSELPRPSETSPGLALAGMACRLRRHADRLLHAIDLADATSRALAILDAYPVQEE